MNSTAGSSGVLGSSNIGGFGYGIGVSVGILLLITTITLASYFCTRTQPPAAPAAWRRSTGEPPDPQHCVVDVGLDEATLSSYPKLLYSQAKLHKKDSSTASCCSVCLADYKNSDTLRLLPDCGHLFHLKCVDPWLRLHPTCPVCRTSPVPTPLSTPLAEIGESMAVVQFNLFVPLFLWLCLLVPLIQASTKVDYCDKKAEYDVKVSGVEISPYPVARGRPATFSISASTGDAISGGKLVIDVSYFGMHIHSETHDLCKETSCPVSTGEFVISHSQVLPGYTPPGLYTLKMRMVDAKKHQLTCIGFEFSIGVGESEAVADS
ncbi:hypothetical protein F0562_015918 [Nyssa sinensis]|uniref:RING-type E3 ubiquitin transferase n=1 Tax=Nyssa sinensis TaxID=561372 RepID=A0A5J4ZKV4_9ASTE|nr:hypothetical protein F0562_015918 [Nyssa sinensis]